MSALQRLVLVALVAFVAGGTLTGCEPCADPSQLWCPDEW